MAIHVLQWGVLILRTGDVHPYERKFAEQIVTANPDTTQLRVRSVTYSDWTTPMQTRGNSHKV